MNPEKENLTVEKLKTFNGLENISDHEAAEIVFAIRSLANIAYEFASEQKQAGLTNLK